MPPPRTESRDPLPLPEPSALSFRKWAPVFLVLCICGIGAAGYSYYRTQRAEITSEVESRLSSIADLKVDQFVAWRRERVADANLLAANPLLAAPRTGNIDQRLKASLEVFRRHAGYAEAALLSESGEVRVGASAGPSAAAGSLRSLTEAAIQSRTVSVSDLYRGPGRTTFIDFVAPLASPERGAVLLRLEASDFVRATVQAWPTPSGTAESLLVRREGDRVRFLTSLRRERGAALRFSAPLRSDLPAAMAARGMEGIRYGVDYHGLPVVAALRRIPNSQWALVVKVDMEEIHAPLRRRSLVIGLFVAILVIASVGAYALLWRVRERGFSRRQHLADLERQDLEGRYAQLSRYVNDIVLLIDDRGKVVAANDRAVASYGYTKEELLLLSIKDLLDETELLHFEARVQSIIHEGSQIYECGHRRKDGSSLPVEVSTRTLQVDGRRHTQSVIRDISERKRAEEQLGRASRALRVLSAGNQAVIRSGDEARLLADICEAIVGAGGYPLAWIAFPENDERKTVRRVASAGDDKGYVDSIDVTWGDEPRGRGPVGTCLRTGQVTVFNELASNADFRVWREQAAEHGYKAIVSLPLQCEGKLLGSLSIYAPEPDAFHPDELKLLKELADDLAFGVETRRRRLDHERAETALLHSAQEFRALFDAANDGALIMDLDGSLLEANPAACQRLGYSREELLTMKMRDVAAPAMGECLRRRRIELLTRGELLVESIHVRKDGTEIPVEVNARLFTFRGAPAVLCAARDVSERKRAEAREQARAAELERAKTEAEDANRAKSRFLANMSHEIRTPMNGIVGMTGLLLDTHLTPEQQEYAETIRSSADALLGVVNDVLDLAKIEAGKITIEPGPFDLIDCLEEIGEFMGPQARAKGIEYVFEAKTEQRRVCGDSGRIRQIVLNLLSNATKFTEHGRVTLRVETAPLERDQPVFAISVTDTGMGIAAADLPRLFTSFSQVDSSLVRRHEGAGLGLAISRQLADLMGGQLTVGSEFGKGTTFLLTLPLSLAEPAVRKESAEDVTPDLLNLHMAMKSPRVLLAEDNVVNQKIGVRVLEKLGCRADVAANGEEAVRMAARFPYDLILMDCSMPQMDGYAATREIRKLQGEGARTPVVALTAHAIAGTREQCLEAGMDDYLAKPVSPAAMRKAIVKWIACGTAGNRPVFDAI